MSNHIRLPSSGAQSLPSATLERLINNRSPVPLPTNVRYVTSKEPLPDYRQAGWIEEQIDPNDPREGWRYTRPENVAGPVNERIVPGMVRARQNAKVLREMNAGITESTDQGSMRNFGKGCLYVITLGYGFGYFPKRR